MTSPPTAAPVVPPARERGWGLVAVALLAFLVVPLTPLLRVLVPTDETALLLAPALAACTIAGWLAGGRAALAVIWTVVAAWSVLRLSGTAGDFALLQGGWALLVAGTFGVLLVARRSAPDERFLPRALRTVAVATAIAAALAVAVPGGTARISTTIAVEAGRRAEESRGGWHQMTDTPEWKDFVSENPSAGQMATLVDEELRRLPSAAETLFPALAGLEALAALALAWAVYHRIGRARLGPPLGTIREFRFNDHLVWGVVGGLGLVLVPGATLLKAIGANLLVFFGALYTIRGVGVFLWMAEPGRLASALLVVVGLLFWNVLGVMALGIGVGDTWLDWRARARQKT